MPNHGDGKLYYRGIDVEDIVAGFIKEKRFGFEETVYLLLFGKMPSEHELAEFRKLLADFRELPSNFMRDVIMKAPTDNMMNTLAKSVLALYSYDDKANDISIPNVLRQSVELITMFPVLSVYAYHAYKYARLGGDLFIHSPRPDLSIAENILYMLRERTAGIPSLKPVYWTWRWCSTQSTAAETTPHSQSMLFPPREPIPIPLSRRHWAR